jgi:hypothetical protein
MVAFAFSPLSLELLHRFPFCRKYRRKLQRRTGAGSAFTPICTLARLVSRALISNVRWRASEALETLLYSAEGWLDRAMWRDAR